MQRNRVAHFCTDGKWLRTTTREMQLSDAKRAAADIVPEARFKQPHAPPIVTRHSPGVAATAISRRNTALAAGDGKPVDTHDNPRATVQSLRQTFASRLLQNGAALAEVQDMPGHGNIRMTRRSARLENATVAARMAQKLDGTVGTPQAESQNRHKTASDRSSGAPNTLKNWRALLDSNQRPTA